MNGFQKISQSDEKSSDQAISFAILTDAGAPLMKESYYPYIQTVEVIHELNMPAMFRIRIRPSTSDEPFWEILEYKLFHLGMEIQIGQYVDMEFQQIILGQVTAIEPIIEPDSNSGTGVMSFEIRGFDGMHRLRFGTKSKVYHEKTDGDIVSEIAQEWNLTPEVVDTKLKYDTVYQYNESDFDFLRHRVNRIRHELIVEKNVLKLREPAEKGEPVSTEYVYRENLHDFRITLGYNVTGVGSKVVGWDVKNKEVIEGVAESGSKGNIADMGAAKYGNDLTEEGFPSAINTTVSSEPVKDKNEAEALAKAHFGNFVSQSVTGRGSLKGNIELLAGRLMKIGGMDRFSGNYYITKSEHVFSSGTGHTTRVEVRRVGI